MTLPLVMTALPAVLPVSNIRYPVVLVMAALPAGAAYVETQVAAVGDGRAAGRAGIYEILVGVVDHGRASGRAGVGEDQPVVVDNGCAAAVDDDAGAVEIQVFKLFVKL